MGLFLPGEGGLQPLFDQPLSDSHNGIDTDGEALGYPRIGPCRTIRIGFQQDIGMPDLVGRSFPRADQLGQVLTFCIGKTHDVFFGHYTLRLIPCSSLKRNDTLVTHKNKDDKALVQCSKESAGTRLGTSGKIGNAHLTWAFSEAATLFLRNNPNGQKLLTRLEKKHSTGKALTILAHKRARAV
jgi:hypothetical protein